MVNNSNDQPPTYDAAMTSEVNSAGPFVPAGSAEAKDVKVPPASEAPAMAAPAAGAPPYSPPSMPPTTVYNYLNPQTGETICTLLPPDHPQMVCLQKGHVLRTRFGVLGVLAAIVWFPFGIACCLLDRRVQCSRCGQTLDDGLCGTV